MKHFMIATVLLLLFAIPGEPLLVGYGVCQTGCASVVVACYAAGGAVFGTVTAGAGVPATILACNVAFGKCQALCWASLMLPV